MKKEYIDAIYDGEIVKKSNIRNRERLLSDIHCSDR